MRASRTRTTLIAASAAVSLAAVVGLAPAASAAGAREPVVIVAHTTFSNPPAADPFESSVDGCESGTVINGAAGLVFLPGGRGLFLGVKEFTCAGGEGGFDIALRSRFGGSGSTGTWTISAAWGSMAGLTGGGSQVGIPGDGGIEDVYTGTLR